MEQLLEKMQVAMEVGGGHEIGVWVSGFYGSGKSSFTKYLGLAFDGRYSIDGQPFLQHLQDRLHRPQTKALLNTVATSFPAAVVMLDLASEQIAGATTRRSIHRPLLQGSAIRRLLPQPQGRGAGAEAEEGGPLRRVRGTVRGETGQPWAGLPERRVGRRQPDAQLAHRHVSRRCSAPTMPSPRSAATSST